MEPILRASLMLVAFSSLPTIACVLLFVLTKAATKLDRRNNIGDTVASFYEFSDEVKYESVLKLSTRDDMKKFLKEMGGNIYGNNTISSNGLLDSGMDYFEDDIPEVIPDVDVPLFKPKD